MMLRAAAPQAPGLARPGGWGGCTVPPATPRYPGHRSFGPVATRPHPTRPSTSRRSRAAGMSAPRSPARVVSVRSWLAAPRGNSLSFRPLRLSTPVTAASSRARSTERLHEPGPGPGPSPGLDPQFAPERFPPDATGPEYSAAAATATNPAAAISQPTTLRLNLRMRHPNRWVGGERGSRTLASTPERDALVPRPYRGFLGKLKGHHRTAAALYTELPAI